MEVFAHPLDSALKTENEVVTGQAINPGADSRPPPTS